MNAIYWEVPCGIAWMVLLARLVFSPYWVYQEYKILSERIVSNLKNSLLKYTTESKPGDGLAGYIEQIAIFNRANLPVGKKMASAYIQMCIRNQGQPSIAERFQAVVEGTDGPAVYPTIHIPEEYTEYDPLKGRKLTFHGKDALYQKTVHPIASGGLARGWLIFHLIDQDAGSLTAPGKKFSVSFVDILQQPHLATFVFPEKGINNIPMSYPGAEQPFADWVKPITDVDSTSSPVPTKPLPEQPKTSGDLES